MRCVSLSCGIIVVQRCCSNFFFDDARRNAFFFFSLLLLRCRFFSNYDVRRAVDERAGVQIRSVPAELKSSYDAKCVHEEEEEEEDGVEERRAGRLG